MAGRNKKKLDPRKSIFISEILTGKNGAASGQGHTWAGQRRGNIFQVTPHRQEVAWC